ncbi:MAG: DUF3108 domain-containing protein [Moraxella sp.]|nr:DUF3108 domain-containing protein [Moraxella sp.]
MVIAGVMMASTANAADIEPFNATYTLKADGKSGTATRTLTKSGNTFTYKVNARAAGIATANQSSTFRLVNGKIAPSNASTSYRIAGFGNTHNIKFAASQVVSTYKGKATTLAMTQQAYDDLSLEANIRQELINGKFTGNYPLVRRTSIENARFKKAGTAQITVPAGTYSAVRIDRVHDDKERATSFWLAPSLGYLPIKVSQTNDGKVISMELNKVN